MEKSNGATHRVHGNGLSQGMFYTLKQVQHKAWDSHFDKLEINLQKGLTRRQARPLNCLPPIKEPVAEIRSLVDRN